MLKFLRNLSVGFFLVFSQAIFATSFVNDFENKIADHFFRNIAYSESSPASFYVGLLTASCSDSTAGTEVSGGSYARVGVTRATASWNGTHGNTTGASSGTNGTISNASAITFAAPTANWGSITYFGLYDASSGGNLIICEALTTPKTVNSGDASPSFTAGALTIQVDN